MKQEWGKTNAEEIGVKMQLFFSKVDLREHQYCVSDGFLDSSTSKTEKMDYICLVSEDKKLTVKYGREKCNIQIREDMRE